MLLYPYPSTKGMGLAMNSIPITGLVDDQHRLSAVVPGSIPPGPMTVWVTSQMEEDITEADGCSESASSGPTNLVILDKTFTVSPTESRLIRRD